MRNIQIIGSGYVGLCCALCLIREGHSVRVYDKRYDTDKHWLEQHQKGNFHIKEPGLMDWYPLYKHHLSFDIEPQSHTDLTLLCIGTPNDAQGVPEEFIESVVQTLEQLGLQANPICIKSTVLPGTTQKLSERLQLKDMVFVPEFLSEGSAIEDFLHPQRTVLGFARGASARFQESIQDLFVSFGRTNPAHETLHTDSTTAELSKYAANISLAARLATVNAIKNISDKYGTDIQDIEKIVGLDKRIGPHYLRSGSGFGGSCLPKDLQALSWVDSSDNNLFSDILKSNTRSLEHYAKRLSQHLSPQSTVLVCGLTFKGNTNDTRHSSVIELLKFLVAQQPQRLIFSDPQLSTPEQENLITAHFGGLSDNIQILKYKDFYTQLRDTEQNSELQSLEAIVFGANHKEYNGLELTDFEHLNQLKLVYDPCRIFEKNAQLSFKYLI